MEEKAKNKTEKSYLSTTAGVNRLLCRIAGADLSILYDPKCTHEISRYARIGAIIIITALLAFTSMFFAIQTISQSVLVGILAGLIWGASIFVLDSYIIASYRKNDNKWKEFRLVLPRLILAFILGCSISIPLELKLFSSEISDELIAMKAEKQSDNQVKANLEYEMRLKPFTVEKEKLLDMNEKLRLEIESATNYINAMNDKMALEKTGKGLTEKAGKGDSYRSLEEQRNYARDVRLSQIVGLNDPQIKDNIQRLHDIDSQIALIMKPVPDNVKLNGLSSQLDGLKRLIAKNNYVLFTYWIFFFLILGIETAPIFVKLFSQKGSYDEILAMNEYQVFLEQQKRKSDLHELINTEIEALRSINIKRGIAQDAINEKTMSAIATAQTEIAEKAIRLWQLEQLDKIDKNVEDFVKSKAW